MGCGSSVHLDVFSRTYTTEDLPRDMALARRRQFLEEVLEMNPVVSRLSLEDQDEIVERMAPVYLKRKETLCREGQVCQGLFVVVEGRLDVHSVENRVTAGFGSEMIMHLGPGDTVGDVNIVMSKCRQRETVTASSAKCEIWKVPLENIPNRSTLMDAATRHLVAVRYLNGAMPMSYGGHDVTNMTTAGGQGTGWNGGQRDPRVSGGLQRDPRVSAGSQDAWRESTSMPGTPGVSRANSGRFPDAARGGAAVPRDPSRRRSSGSWTLGEDESSQSEGSALRRDPSRVARAADALPVMGATRVGVSNTALGGDALDVMARVRSTRQSGGGPLARSTTMMTLDGRMIGGGPPSASPLGGLQRSVSSVVPHPPPGRASLGGRLGSFLGLRTSSGVPASPAAALGSRRASFALSHQSSRGSSMSRGSMES
eukprot:CAMPEP_0182858120 /NCGR_PEP_ID=MMETSP0034_2-20130328/3473_1 /TAXON_ID=156128 /ORGANISM="Nephroselmis pyriformis, Strain CCMP717" /LENGTH=425 /DNA_ID=CAMNT_0024989473 /DNA_START=146 /DNA_END=1419 /DNA_ORIENTATION=-